MDFLFSIIGTVFSVLGIALFQYWGWTLIAAFLVWQIFQNRRKVEFVESSEHTLLQIIVPKDNDKKELSAEQLFASLHGILRSSAEIEQQGVVQEHVSFEIASEGNVINFYVWVPRHLRDYVESQIYAQYPTVQILDEVKDYSKADLGERLVVTSDITTTKDSIFPIRTFATFEVDPLAGITTVLAQLAGNEQLWIQVLVRPVDDAWHAKSLTYIEESKNGKKKGLLDNWEQRIFMLPLELIVAFLEAIFVPKTDKKDEKKDDKKKELSTGQTTINAAIEAKAEKIGYAVKIRVAYIGDEADLAKQRLQALFGGFKQFNTINLNGLKGSGYDASPEALQEYRARYFEGTPMILNVEELASLYHLPHTSVETPNIAWTTGKVGEPPTNLPTLANTEQDALSLIGSTNFRQTNIKFGMKREDRKRHLYIIGKSGSGKSFLLLLLALSDIYHDQGFAIVDPHGDFAQDALRYIPEHRLDDVVYFNPPDFEFPISFNPMENDDPNMRAPIASEIIGVLKKMFADSWGPRLEHILRFTLLALLETPDANLMGITRMLTDKAFRKKVVDQVTDSTVKAFWVNEFASWNDKFATEAVAPILNKVGAFTANPLIRNVIGQEHSKFDIRKLMDEGKILICDLSRGRLGEDNAATLGALMITKIQLAAMSRANIPMSERRPFYLYVDEFQNFATDSFAVILSEARKYGLYLTVANQYVAQMPMEVRDAVFGNVGSMITFRVGADDASALARYFEPTFEAGDLTNLSLQQVYVTMSIDGETSIPFSAKTLRLPDPSHDYTESIVAKSRAKYNVDRATVEKQIATWNGVIVDANMAQSQGEGESHLGNGKGDQRLRVDQLPAVAGGQPQGAQSSVPVPEPRSHLEVSGAQPRNYSELMKSANNSSTGHPRSDRPRESRDRHGNPTSGDSQRLAGGERGRGNDRNRSRNRSRGNDRNRNPRPAQNSQPREMHSGQSSHPQQPTTSATDAPNSPRPE